MKLTIDEVLHAKIRNRERIVEAARHIDAFRRKYGKPSKGFDAVSLLRKLRDTR